MPPLSNSRVDKAGEYVRRFFAGEGDDALVEHAGVIGHFRELHAQPLNAVAANLRYFATKHARTGTPIVGQRLKRFITICDKLTREPTLRLSQMQDVGGCRVVVRGEPELRSLVADLLQQKRWRIVTQDDYVARPKPVSGYRAHHLIVKRDGRLIEVQVRTRPQHEWAEAVERVDRKHGLGLKEGRARADIVEYYRLGAALIAAGEQGGPTDLEVFFRFRDLHPLVMQYLHRDR